MTRTLFYGLFASLSLFALPGCGSKEEKGPDILCTTNVVADVVRQVAGGHKTVGVLIKTGDDPHTFSPSSGDARALRSARMIFYSGLHLEGKITETLEDMGRKKPVVALAEGLDQSRIIKDEKGAKDPHAWFDLELWSDTANIVAETLAKEDPAHADDYKANAKKYRDSLRAAHKELKVDMATIPKSQRVLVTAHDAFEYFSRAYGIEVRAIQGVSTESEAGLKEMNLLADFMAERKVKAVFVETSVSEENVKSLIAKCKDRKHKAEIGGELYSDSIGEEGTPEGTLEGAVRKNVKIIVDALK